MKPGDVVWCAPEITDDDDEKGPRRGVVLELREHVRVAYCQGEEPRVDFRTCVPNDSPTGRRLGLSKPSWFCGRNVALFPRQDLAPIPGAFCRDELFRLLLSLDGQ